MKKNILLFTWGVLGSILLELGGRGLRFELPCRVGTGATTAKTSVDGACGLALLCSSRCLASCSKALGTAQPYNHGLGPGAT